MTRTQKALLVLSILVTVVTVVAQSIPIADKSQRLYWDDPNPTGTVASWVVYCSNAVSGVRSLPVSGSPVPYSLICSNLPNSTYTIWNTSVNLLGTESDPSTNHIIHWLGAHKPGINLRTAP